MKAELRGTGVALATPLNDDYTVDYPSLGKLIEHIIDGNCDYLVVQGTTGESPVFSWSEKLQILEYALDTVKNRIPVVFGLGGNHTLDLIDKANDLKGYNLAAILSVSPYYSRPSQEGILRHYQMLADAFPFPIILYNVPSRTASNVEAQTTLKLSMHPNIIAMKEASGDIDQCKQITEAKSDDFFLLSGDDAMAHEIIKLGGEGVISVIGNLMPKAFTEMVNATLNGQLDQASEMNKRLTEAYKMLSEEGNPSSLKAGLEVIQIGQRTVKPPLFDASNQLIDKWKAYLKV